VDDRDYFFPGADDSAYRGYPASGGGRAGGRHHGAEQLGSVWQRVADGPWSPLDSPVPERAPARPGWSPEDPGFGWDGVPPGSGPWPQAPRTWGGLVREQPYDPSAGHPADGHRPGYGAARDVPPTRRPRNAWADDPPRDRGPRRRPAPDSARRPSAGTSLLAGYAPGTGPMGRVRDAARPAPPPPPPRSPSRGTGPVRRVPPPVAPPAPSRASYGRALPDWLPFGRRLVLLPKEAGGGAAPPGRLDVNGGWLRPAVFGALDGLVTNSALIAGIGGGGGGHGMIALTGIAGLIAGASSMATGEYISVRSQNELTQAQAGLERRPHVNDPAGKLDRMTRLFIEKGVSPNLAEAVARQISANPDRAVATHLREELSVDPDDLPSPRTAAVASLTSFAIGALVPLSPFLAGIPSLPAALVLAGLFAFVGGGAVARLTGRPAALGGLRQFAAVFLAVGLAFFVGHLVGGHVG
jgi:VIT1/CCC1 family predicted Fe2+/Mn2+ transporter